MVHPLLSEPIEMIGEIPPVAKPFPSDMTTIILEELGLKGKEVEKDPLSLLKEEVGILTTASEPKACRTRQNRSGEREHGRSEYRKR
jgi:hypothetical protein